MNHDCINAPRRQRRKRALKFVGFSHLDGFNLHPISLGFTAQHSEYLHESWVDWMYEDSHLGDARLSLFEQLQPLGSQFFEKEGHSRDVPAGLRVAGNEAQVNG